MARPSLKQEGAEMNWERLRLMRTAARVQRMHTMTCIRPQSVGEHTFGILALIIEVCDASFMQSATDLMGISTQEQIAERSVLKIMTAAIYHDAPEAITGDIPSPVKWRHKAIETGLKDAEREIAKEFSIGIQLTDLEKSILKFCDLMELAMYALEEVDTGNKALAVVHRNAMSAIIDRKLTDVTPSALRLFDLMRIKYEAHYLRDLGNEVTHGWPEYK